MLQDLLMDFQEEWAEKLSKEHIIQISIKICMKIYQIKKDNKFFSK